MTSSNRKAEMQTIETDAGTFYVTPNHRRALHPFAYGQIDASGTRHWLGNAETEDEARQKITEIGAT